MGCSSRGEWPYWALQARLKAACCATTFVLAKWWGVPPPATDRTPGQGAIHCRNAAASAPPKLQTAHKSWSATCPRCPPAPRCSISASGAREWRAGPGRSARPPSQPEAGPLLHPASQGADHRQIDQPLDHQRRAGLNIARLDHQQMHDPLKPPRTLGPGDVNALEQGGDHAG